MRPEETLERMRVVETLQGLMDRLCAPDLTAAESQTLRPRLLQLLEAIEAEKRRKAGPVAGDRKATREPLHRLAV